MTPRIRALSLRPVLLAGASLLGALPGQESCAECRAAGIVPCDVCVTQESGVELCSVAMSCRACRGAGAVSCKGCVGRSSAGETSLLQRRNRANAWLAERREQAQGGGRAADKILYCRTRFFDLTFALDALADTPTRDPHALMHLYADRILAARAMALELVGALPSGESGTTRGEDDPRLRIALVGDAALARRLAAEWTGTELQGLSVRSRAGPISFVLLQGTGTLRKDASLHRLVVHQTAHAYLAAHSPGGTWSDSSYGWLEEGIAHVCEQELAGGICEHYCYLGQAQPPRLYFGGRWRPAARQLLEAGRIAPMPVLIGRSAADLDFTQHVGCFALVDWLRTRASPPVTPRAVEERTPLRELWSAAKANRPPAAALHAALGVDAEVADREFLSWIRTTYPQR